MRNAERRNGLDVLRERGRRGLLVEVIYRQLFNPQLYLLARPGLPHRLGRGGENLDRDQLAYRGRYLPWFDRLDSRVRRDTLGEKIHDNRLLRLVGQMLAAGYLENWVWNATLSGVPQGGGPVLVPF